MINIGIFLCYHSVRYMCIVHLHMTLNIQPTMSLFWCYDDNNTHNNNNNTIDIRCSTSLWKTLTNFAFFTRCKHLWTKKIHHISSMETINIWYYSVEIRRIGIFFIWRNHMEIRLLRQRMNITHMSDIQPSGGILEVYSILIERCCSRMFRFTDCFCEY